ncbi:MAG: hypothetical protein HY907_12005 [Deltaproteobacteria bacterium]|nr:hypothetical protein [Deltaproteobacteria bacterium]
MGRRLVLGVVWAALVGGFGCQEQGTEIVFEVTTGYLVPEQVNAAAITILGLGPDMTPESAEACRTSRSLDMGPGLDVDGSTFTFAVRAGEVCDRRVFFEVTLIKDALDIVTSSGFAEFESGRSVRVVINIPRNSSCDGGQQWCGTACSDVATDGGNCGWCGNACGTGKACVGGWCRCPGGQAECGGSCIDVQTDRGNCGGCGTACGESEVCVDGSCTAACPDPLRNCGGRCVDTRSDPLNCGGCGTACGDETRCLDGACGACRPPQGGPCDPIAQCGCPPGQRCDAAMEPFYTPQENCVREGPAQVGEMCNSDNRCARGLGCFRGVYGEIPVEVGGRKSEGPEPGTCLPWCVRGDPAACGGEPDSCRALLGQAGQSPEYGVCLPFMGLEMCNWIDDDGFNGADDGVDVGYDPWNCGQCFKTCMPGETCQEGSCQACSGWPFQDCGAGCTDLSWDRANCGSCGHGCGMLEACVGGECQPDCAELLPVCRDPTGEGTRCVDTERDPDNCGYCGAPPCEPGQACIAGGCTNACAAGLDMCYRWCIDTTTHPGNCGGCDFACPAGSDCAPGTGCFACTPAPARPGGACYVPTQCGCADDQVCVLADAGGEYTEVCRTPYGEYRELATGCHLTLADCEPGLQCVPTEVAYENRCIRPCVGDDECSSGKCLHEDVPDWLAPYGICRSVGGPCTNDWDCPGEMPLCVTALGTGVIIPGGYCTFGCDPADGRCPPGSRCVAYGFDRVGAACLATCATDEDCRAGYRCLAVLGNVCFPDII